LVAESSEEFKESSVKRTFPVDAERILESNSDVIAALFFSFTAPLKTVPTGIE
jgi:hypothetical protein